MKFHGQRRARISVNEPINLADSYADWQRDGDAQVDRMTLQLEETVRSRLTELCRKYRTDLGT